MNREDPPRGPFPPIQKVDDRMHDMQLNRPARIEVARTPICGMARAESKHDNHAGDLHVVLRQSRYIRQ